MLTVTTLTADEFSDNISLFIRNKPENSAYTIDGEELYSSKVLQQFYQNRNYSLAWINAVHPVWKNPVMPFWIKADSPEQLGSNGLIWSDAGSFAGLNTHLLGKNAYDLLEYIRQINQHGLHPTDYHLVVIEEYINKAGLYAALDAAYITKLDILLSDAFFLLGLQLYYGKVDSEKEGESWKLKRKEPKIELDINLEKALAGAEIDNVLNLLAPSYPAYWKMKAELAFFGELESEPWNEIVSSKSINPGDSNQLLPKIRERLIKLRYPLPDANSPFFDKELEKQVRIFQKDWGLNADGVIGKGSLLALNTNPNELINRLKVNMERFRWLPLKKPYKYIIVNIASFDLTMIEGADTLISMRAIVGKDYRKTPVFDALITYIVFSPDWTIPPTILKNDVIPQLLISPGYLEKKNMKLLRYNGTEIAYSEIDWSALSADNFPYMVRQNPGPMNALGKVKFMFPNSYNVYIHDTPSRRYFARDDRAMSSGCIRIEKPFELAELLLANSPDWTSEKIDNAMHQTQGQTVSLKTPVNVLLLYLTAWSSGNDRVQFRNDIYMRDDLVLKALNQKSKAEKIKVIPF